MTAPRIPRWWKVGARVLVHEAGTHFETAPLMEPKPGIIRRLTSRNKGAEAVVELDHRLTGDDARHHAFPADDEGGRGKWVSADCQVCTHLIEAKPK